MKEHQRYYARARTEAQARKASRNDLEARAEEAHFFWMLEEELDMFESRRLIRLAKKYRVPIPERTRRRSDREDDPNWRVGSTFRPDEYLTDSAMYELRGKIRAERKAKYEEIRLWAPTVVALMAALATIYGVTHGLKK
jgi:hypothetical protein